MKLMTVFVASGSPGSIWRSANTTETVKSFEKRHLIFIVSFQSFESIDFTFEASEEVVHC